MSDVYGTWEILCWRKLFLPSVKVPYLSIHGSDPGDGYASWLAEKVPTARLEIWEGDAHYPHMVEPERFAARVRQFSAS